MNTEDEIKKRLQLLLREVQSLYDIVASRGAVVFPNEAAQKLEQRICLECGKKITAKEAKRSTRGVHERCYQRQRRAMKDGLITEQQLIANGQLAPHSKPGRRREKTQAEIEMEEAAKKRSPDNPS